MTKKQQKRKLLTPTKPSTRSEPVELTFLEHVHELRSRLFWVVSTIIVASTIGFQFKDQLVAAVMAPLHGQKLVYLTPGGGFGFIFAVALYFGILLAIPVIIYHLYRFLQPLLVRASRRFIIGFMLLSCLLAIAGTTFGYFVTIPAALDFLASFAGDAVIPNLTAESYLNFVVTYVLGLALLFQLPLLLFLFDHVRPIPPSRLLSSQRFVIIGATVVAAVITPTPDVFNMLIMAVPIIAIYQFGVIAIYARQLAAYRSPQKTQSRRTVSVPDTATYQSPVAIFRTVTGHQPITAAPVRTVTRRGYYWEKVVVEPVAPPRSNLKVTDEFVHSGPLPTGESASARRLAAAQASYVKPSRTLDGLLSAQGGQLS